MDLENHRCMLCKQDTRLFSTQQCVNVTFGGFCLHNSCFPKPSLLGKNIADCMGKHSNQQDMLPFLPLGSEW